MALEWTDESRYDLLPRSMRKTAQPSCFQARTEQGWVRIYWRRDGGWDAETLAGERFHTHGLRAETVEEAQAEGEALLREWVGERP